MVKKIVTWQTKDGRCFNSEDDANRHEMVIDARHEMRSIIQSLMNPHMPLIEPDKLLAALLAKDSKLLAMANQYQQNYFKNA